MVENKITRNINPKANMRKVKCKVCGKMVRKEQMNVNIETGIEFCTNCIEPIHLMSADRHEEIAFDTLREIISRGRNNQPYKHLLSDLKEQLKTAPQTRKALQNIKFPTEKRKT